MVEFAEILMWIGLVGAVGASISPARLGNGLLIAAVTACAACVVLGHALWRLDLSVIYVADHARTSIGGAYRVAGLWGGASGSLLMFTAMVALAVTLLARTRTGVGDRSLAHTPTRWGSATVAALMAAVLLFANPFGRLQIPAIDGNGLQPILEHPAMLYHPPLLYAGLVSTVVPWLLALNARRDPDWRRPMRSWLGVSLVLLTLGQATGSNWAYVELGWGGFWGWDPVENGVLVAWLCVVVALHSIGQPGHHRLVAVACAAPWLAVLVCTTVTRAGIGDSVHAFADDARISLVLATLIGATLAVTVYMLSGLDAAPARLRRLPFVSMVIVVTGAAVVLEGVLYPLVAPGDPLVTGHFYATVLGPVALVALAASSVALSAREPARSTPERPRHQLAGRLLAVPLWVRPAGGALAGLVIGTLVGARTPFAILTSGAVGAVIVGLLAGIASGSRGRWAMRCGHVGFAVLLIGVAGSTQAVRATVSLSPGERVELGGVVFTHRTVEVVAGPSDSSDAVVASLALSSPDDVGARSSNRVVLHPALVAFTDRNVLLAETGLNSRPWRDVQVVLRTATDDGGARYDLSVTPLIQAVWWGSALLMLAGLVMVGDYFRLRSRSARARSSNADIVADSASTTDRLTSSSNAASSSATV